MDNNKLIVGDMPGDIINIDESHIKRTKVIYPHIFNKVNNKDIEQKIVVSVYGGSGVGKSEVGSLLATELSKNGIKSYVMSGDNYPYRIPVHNDQERLNRYRYAALLAIKDHSDFNENWIKDLNKLIISGNDINKDFVKEYKFLSTYQTAGEKALANFIASTKEIDFSLVNSIITNFKNNTKYLNLKRMGRTESEISFEKIDFVNTKVLIIEWTHGNNSKLNDIDYPIFLFSTPEETLRHRLSRGRDKGVDSPFTNCVLEIEQKILNEQYQNSFLIVGKTGNIISKGEFSEL